MNLARTALVFSLCAGLATAGCDMIIDGPASSSSTPGPTRIDSAPTLVSLSSFAELEALHADLGQTPEGAVKAWLMAVVQYGSDNLAEYQRGRDGLKYLTLGFKEQADWESLPSYQTFVERTWDQPHIFRSYAAGATPDNGYAMDPDAFELDVHLSREDAGGRGWAVHLRSGGADSPRPVYLKQSTTTGLWFMSSFDNIYLEVRDPIDPTQEQFE